MIMGYASTRFVKRFTGTAAPATTPSKVGDIFVDTANNRTYVAHGTSSSADWKEVLTAA